MNAEPQPAPNFPKAIAAPRSRLRGIPGLLIFVVLCAVTLAIYATYSAFQTRGTAIEIRFANGDGLQVGDQLRHRGVGIGEVTEIQLSEDLENVVVKAMIRDDAKSIATEGTRFWVVKPEVNLQGLKGLETVFGGQYIAVDPSRRMDKVSTSFVGLSAAPAVQLPGSSLEIVLETADAKGIQNGAPVRYRGIEVGRIHSIGLAPDSRWVRIFASIDADYQSLVRDNSVFWNNSGVKMNVGITGVALEANTIASVALGGIEFATPEPPGNNVAIGHKFPLSSEPEEAWKSWQTPIATGPGLRLDLQTLPTMQQAALKWKTSFYGIKRTQQRTGWVLTLSNGVFVGPTDLFKTPDGIVEGSGTFECLGKIWPIDAITFRSKTQDNVCRVHLPDVVPDTERWPIEKLGALKVENFRKGQYLLCEGNQRYVPLEERDFDIQQGKVKLVGNERFPMPLHGSAILDIAERTVVGMVVATEDAEEIVVQAIPE